jgi:hypothetical protein
MALHILNFSIDNPHTLFENNKVDTDFNEVDSVVELVLEDVLSIDNAIPEHHTKTPVTHKFNAKKVVWVFEHEQPIHFNADTQDNYRLVLDNTLYYKKQFYLSPQVSFFSPPPEV